MKKFLIFPFLILLTACNTVPDYSSSPTPGQSSTLTLSAKNTIYGNIIVDQDGHTLYANKENHNDDSGLFTPVHTRDSVVASPPLSDNLVSVNKDFVVMYNGHVLYQFVGDTLSGDINAQGRNNVWFVVNENGDLVDG